MFIIKDGARWLLDSFFSLPRDEVVMRASGTLPHANVLGGFLMFSILATYALVMRAKNQWALGLTLPFQVFAMCLSFSRSALFGWALGTGVFFLSLAFRGIEKKRLAWLGKTLLLSFSLSFVLLFNQYIQRGGVISTSSLSTDSDHIRMIHQKSALEIIKEYPLTGLGFSQFSECSQKFLSHTNDAYIQSTAPHNIFLFLACETGLISACAFLLFFVLLAYRALKAPFNLEIGIFFSLLIAFLFIGVCDFYPILFQQGKLMLFSIAALLSLHTKPFPNEKFATHLPI